MSRSHRSLLRLIGDLRGRVLMLETKMLDKELTAIIEAGFKNPERFFRKEDELNWSKPTGFTPEYLAAQEELNRMASERLKRIRAEYCSTCGAKKKA